MFESETSFCRKVSSSLICVFSFDNSRACRDSVAWAPRVMASSLSSSEFFARDWTASARNWAFSASTAASLASTSWRLNPPNSCPKSYPHHHMPPMMASRVIATSARQGHGRCERTDILGASMLKCLKYWRTRRQDTGIGIVLSGGYGKTASAVSPVVSGSPNIRFMFWIAWPAAPFTRLSSTARMSAVSPPCGR